MKKLLTLMGLAMLCTSGVKGQVFINEILANPPGTDGVNTFFELRGTASTALTGHYLIGIEGDSTATPGTIDYIFNLSSFSIGTNGFLVGLVTGHPYSIAPGTTIATSIGDPENQSNTFVLLNIGAGAAPTLTFDLDAGDNGLDALPSGWLFVDSVGLLDGGANDRSYGAITFSHDADGFTEVGSTFVNLGWAELEYVARVGNSTGSSSSDWAAADISGTVPILTVDVGNGFNIAEGTDIASTLGSVNPIPEPTTWALIGLGSAFALSRIRRRSNA